MTQPVQFSPTLQQFGSDRAISAYEELTCRSKHALLMERAEPPVAWIVEADNVPKQPGAAPTAHADCKHGGGLVRLPVDGPGERRGRA